MRKVIHVGREWGIRLNSDLCLGNLHPGLGDQVPLPRIRCEDLARRSHRGGGARCDPSDDQLKGRPYPWPHVRGQVRLVAVCPADVAQRRGTPFFINWISAQPALSWTTDMSWVSDSGTIWPRCTTLTLFGRGAGLGHYLAEVHNSSTFWSRYFQFKQGDVGDGEDILVRVHSECLTGDIFGSARCDCGDQLELAMQMIEKAGRGVLVYLRGHEGRGIGLGHKLRAYNLQDDGRDTVEANEELQLPVDSREYGIGALVRQQIA
ncbi:hypothetical protein BHE74_00019973 [Ensete ventricosum]|nr:hypothetical protein BHE74_00019973 [Ensete ventricosum]